MSKSIPPYPARCRQQMVELVRAGRTPAELSCEFNFTAQSITNWVAQAAIGSGKPLFPVRKMCHVLGVSASGFYAGIRGIGRNHHDTP